MNTLKAKFTRFFLTVVSFLLLDGAVLHATSSRSGQQQPSYKRRRPRCEKRRCSLDGKLHSTAISANQKEGVPEGGVVSNDGELNGPPFNLLV